MGLRTIEQKMKAACLWSGEEPFGDLVRSALANAADNVTLATKTWVFANGAFVAADVGRKFLVANANTAGNNGCWTIATVVGGTTVTSVEEPAGNETFSDGDVTAAVYDPGTLVNAYDMEAYPSGISGGLFDFGNLHPIIVHNVVLIPGTSTTSWKIELVDRDGAVATVATVATANPYYASLQNGKDISGLVVLQGQKLKLTSVGVPSTASRARITVASYRD